MPEPTPQPNSEPQQQQQAAPWFGEAHKPYVETKGWKSPDDVITSAQNLEKLLGADRAGRTLVMPKDDKDVEGIKAFRAKLGVPEKVDGYQVPDALKESLKDDPIVPAFAAAALEEGVPAKAFGNLLTKVIAAAETLRTDNETKAKTASDAAIAQLKGEWGANFEANTEMGKRFVRAAGVTDEQLAALEGALGSANMLKMIHGWGAKMGEPGSTSGQNAGGGSMLNKSQAESKVTELRAARLANQISEKDYLTQLEQLGPIVAPGTFAA